MATQPSPYEQDKNDVLLYMLGILFGVVLVILAIVSPTLLPFPQIVSVLLAIAVSSLSLRALVSLLRRSAAAQEESIWMVIVGLWHLWH